MDLDSTFSDTAPPTFQQSYTSSVLPPVASSPFGLVISECPVRTDFTQVDVNKFTCTLSCPGDIPIPLSAVSEVALFLLQPLPAQTGLLIYWQLSSGGQTTEFELLGSLTAQQPSRIFYTGWGEHEQIVAASNAPLTLTMDLSLEPSSSVQNLTPNSKHHTRLHVAQKIATDLFQFMQSFDTGTSGPGQMVVPNNIFDRWMKRFENRLKRNPNFFLKSQNEE